MIKIQVSIQVVQTTITYLISGSSNWNHSGDGALFLTDLPSSPSVQSLPSSTGHSCIVQRSFCDPTWYLLPKQEGTCTIHNTHRAVYKLVVLAQSLQQDVAVGRRTLKRQGVIHWPSVWHAVCCSYLVPRSVSSPLVLCCCNSHNSVGQLWVECC